MTFKEVDKIVKFDKLTAWSFDLNQLESVVYFLLHKGECVYVGLTRNEQLFRRMSSHLAAKKKGKKIFDTIKVVCVIDSIRAKYTESMFIRCLCPKYNKRERTDAHKHHSEEFNRRWLKELFSEVGTLKKALTGEKGKVAQKEYVKRKRITLEQVIEIKEKIKEGVSCVDIEKDSHFSLVTIHRIKSGTHYLCKQSKK